VRWLRLAAQAEAQGDDDLKRQLLDGYIAELQKVSGSLLSPVHVDVLISIARGL
jgi:hypothetical protein